MAKRGVLISFEGVDGSGKSTQARMLFEFLKQQSFDVIFIREPGGTPISESIREILLDKTHDKMNPRTELLLFLASRSELVDKIIGPALQEGKIIVTDRFSDSTFSYQINGRRLAGKVVRSTNAFAADRTSPDLTFVVDLDVNTAHKRLKANKDRMESAADDFHRRVRQGFLSIAKAEPRRVKVMDGSKSQQEIFSEILAITQPFLTRRKIVPQRRLTK